MNSPRPNSHWLIQSSDEVARGGVHEDKDGGPNSKNDEKKTLKAQ